MLRRSLSGGDSRTCLLIFLTDFCDNHQYISHFKGYYCLPSRDTGQHLKPHSVVLMPSNLEVRAQATLLHCSTTGGWCLQLASISLAVFQYGGVGKQRAQARSHTSNSTAISFSASFSATPTKEGKILFVKSNRNIYIDTLKFGVTSSFPH